MRKSVFFDCILLVDDDPITNFINTKILSKLNITQLIVAKENGEEALKFLIEKGCPALIFLDINMPVMNGFEFIEAFKKEAIREKDKTKIVVLSSSIDIADRKKIDSYGLPFLNKPLNVEKMEAVIGGIPSV